MHSPASEVAPTPELDQDTVFEHALNAFYDLPFETESMAGLAERNINQEDTGNPAYWRAAADFAHQKAAERYEAGDDPATVALDTLCLVTPNAIHTAAQLESQGRAMNGRQYAHERSYMTTFNRLLREAGDEVPDLRASLLHNTLLNAANSSRDPFVQKRAADMLRQYIRGAQHERVFGLLLEATGLPSESSEEADGQGTDFTAYLPNGTSRRLDVKASLAQIQGKPGQLARRRSDGTLVIYSMVTDRELNDRFSLPDLPDLDERVAYLRDVITQDWHEAVA